MPRGSLSTFQREKLTYYFKFYEPNENNELDEKSLQHFMNRVLEFTGWSPDSLEAHRLYEVHEAFFEIMFDKTAPEHGDTVETGNSCDQKTVSNESKTVTLDDWLSVWSGLIPGCTSMSNFPVWLRLLPKQLFKAIDRDKDGKITEQELFDFYYLMVKLPLEEAKKNSHFAFAQMTDNGHYPIDMDGYEQIFANFLLGQTPHGPGRHVFGCFEHSPSIRPFRLIQPAPEPDEGDVDVKVVAQKRPKRMSISERL